MRKLLANPSKSEVTVFQTDLSTTIILGEFNDDFDYSDIKVKCDELIYKWKCPITLAIPLNPVRVAHPKARHYYSRFALCKYIESPLCLGKEVINDPVTQVPIPCKVKKKEGEETDKYKFKIFDCSLDMRDEVTKFIKELPTDEAYYAMKYIKPFFMEDLYSKG